MVTKTRACKKIKEMRKGRKEEKEYEKEERKKRKAKGRRKGKITREERGVAKWKELQKIK